MMEFDFAKIGGWLDLTDQQFQILSVVHRLELSRRRPSPKNIVLEYESVSDKLIAKPNLFTILKALCDRGLVRRVEQGSYAVDFEVVREVLAKRIGLKEAELDQLRRVVDETEKFFKKELKSKDIPYVTYLDHDELYSKLSKIVSTASQYFIVANFPSVAYTYTVYSRLRREDYWKALVERTLKEKSLHACFLTDLNVDSLFTNAFIAFGDPSKAYKESKLILGQLGNLVDECENLDVRFHEEPHGLSVAISEREEDWPGEFIILTRDEHNKIKGGIHIKSPEPARQAKEMFVRLFDYAEKLEGKVAEKRISEAVERLDAKYGVLGK